MLYLNGSILHCCSLISYGKPTPAATAGLTPTFITSEMLLACVAHLYKIKTLAFCFVKTMKICVIPTSVLHQGWLVVVLVLAFTHDRLFHNVPDMLTYESTCCTSQQVFLFSVLGSRPSCWLFNMDICRWAVAKGNQWSDWLKKLSAALVLKGYLFQPSSSSDSKYVTNLGLDNELMNSISR